MPRFFTPTDGLGDGIITIRGEDAHHIARALRMAEGDTVTVCDMQGREHTCRLDKIRDEEVICRILETREGATEPPVHITLYMAYPKGDKLETVVQKAVELGASEIVPFESSRCIKRPSPEKAERNTARLSRIAEEAAKQCGRSRIPEVRMPVSFSEALKSASRCDLAIFCYEGDGTRSLKQILGEAQQTRTVSVVVGCEGGFSREEAEAAAERGFAMANLGRRILRCETAPAFALSSIIYHFEL